MSEIAVAIGSVTKRFPRRRGLREVLRAPLRRESALALDEVSFSVRGGECFGLLGENGAGKTTLFRLLSTLLLADGGTLTVHGVDVTRDPGLVRRLIAPVPPSERSLFWRLSATENLELFAALHGLPVSAARPRIRELLELMGLAGTGRQQVGAYSSGMRQRLLLARALLPSPRVLLLDEPTRSLDPVGARAFRRFLRDRVLGAAGCTALIATHIPEEVSELCDRLAVLHRGRLIAQGTASELASQVAPHRLRLLLSSAMPPALGAIVESGGITLAGAPYPLDDGLWAQDLDAPSTDTGDLLAHLVRAGVPVRGLERAEVPLADVLERLTGTGLGRVTAHA